MKKCIFMMAVGMLFLTACNAGNSKSQSSEISKVETTDISTGEYQSEHAVLIVQGNCEMCKERIEKAAKGVEGVSSAKWNVEQKELHLDFDSNQTNADAISQAVAKAGYDTNKDKANDETYNALPDCCKYR
jgi:Cu(I)/Ag(I) efflux system membrane fusion protein